MFKNWPKCHQIFWILLERNFLDKNIQNRPIWSRWPPPVSIDNFFVKNKMNIIATNRSKKMKK